MKRAAWIAIAVLAIFLVWFFLIRKKSARGSAFPTARPFAATARPFSPLKTIFPGRKMATTGSPLPGSPRPVSTLRPTGAIPTVRPEIVPPFTLGPVPNGVTRVPEPPTAQPYADADFEESADYERAGPTVFDQPAGAHANSVAGISVPSVQNPWDVSSWKFLIGAPVEAAQAIVANLFPSFPVSVRSTSDPPLMSCALVIKHDGSGKVVTIVRD